MKMNILSPILIFCFISFAFSGFKFPDANPPQIFKTTLQVIVRNDLGNTEEGASVTLYKTEEDYNESKNPASKTLKTDSKGKVTFDEVEAISYFVQAEKGDKNNSGAGEKTPKLDHNKLNKITIIISE